VLTLFQNKLVHIVSFAYVVFGINRMVLSGRWNTSKLGKRAKKHKDKPKTSKYSNYIFQDTVFISLH